MTKNFFPRLASGAHMADEEVGGDTSWERWELRHLDADSGVPLNMLPSAEELKSLCKQLRDKFTLNQQGVEARTSPNDLFYWACRSLEIDPNQYDHEDAIRAVKREHFRIQRLRIAVEENVVMDEDCMTILENALRVVTSAERFLLQAGRLFVYASETKDQSALAMLPKQIRVETEFMKGGETILDYDETKLDHFQKLFLDLRIQLEAARYRRAEGKFFRRVKTVNGGTTLAYEEATTIEAWIGERTNYNVNFQAWFLSTRPSCNFANVVKYMCERPLPEAPDLSEHPYLRSFAGDEVGRGSGVYDCDSDMFFPYGLETRWPEMAAKVQDIRRQFCSDYKCQPPSTNDTALLHLNCSFPYDVYEEVIAVGERDEPYCVWREAYEFEVRRRPELHAPRLAELLATSMQPLGLCDGAKTVTGQWRCVVREAAPPLDYVALQAWWDDEDDIARVADGDVVLREDEGDVPPDGRCYVALPQTGGLHRFFVPLMAVAPLPRHQIDAADVERMTEGTPGPRSWVRHGERYFCVCNGFHWGDVESAEMDQIYQTQGFTDYDRFQCYANKGRQFFPVGKKDHHQFAAVYEGVGGCGKSTDLTTQVRFYPPHRQGMFPGNIEPLFGLSAACKEGEALAMFCSEMSANMACKQEEFNQIISGDKVSAARKNKAPWVGVVRGQLFMVGNKKPANYSDDQGQFTRRLMGIYMPNQVRPRDGRVAAVLDTKMGQLCRRNVLAYDCFRDMWGSTDPMSQIDLLPPGFRGYYEQSLRETNPMKAFLDDPECPFKFDDAECVLFEELKQLYLQYRSSNGMGTGGRFDQSHYHTVFQNYSLTVRTEENVVIKGEAHSHVKVVVGLVHSPAN